MNKIKNILIFTVTCFVTLFVLDIYIYSAMIQTRSSIEYSSNFGDVRIPNSMFLNLEEGFGFGSFNDFGYLGPSYPQEKSEDVIRIALIGDSYVEGYQVTDKLHFRNLTESKLENILGKKVEILNFGRSGFNLINMYALDSLIVTKYSCDLTIYFFNNKDLIENNFNTRLPFVSLDDLGNILIEIPKKPNGFDKFKYIIASKSSIYVMLSKCIDLAKEEGFLKRKFFDKLITSNQEKNKIFPKHKKMGDVQYAILNKLKEKNNFIINRDTSKLYLDKEMQILNKLDIFSLFTENGHYNWYYHKWEATNKIGHYNLKGHKLVADGLTETILEVLSEKTNIKRQ